MKSMKKMLIFLIVLTLVFGSFSLTSYSNINGYEIIDDMSVENVPFIYLEDGEIWGEGKLMEYYSNEIAAIMPTGITDYTIINGIPVQSVPPTTLYPGQIWTGKSVSYNSDGTATITLSAWGNTWEDASNLGVQNMPLDSNEPFVTITDDIGEFHFDPTLLPGGVTAGPNNTVVWQINQSEILGAAPTSVSYAVYLDEVTWRTGYWYSTGTAEVEFYPVQGNPFYWTMEEVMIDAFTANVNWNNGTGINSAMIVDNILNITISFGSNNSPANQTAAMPTFPNNWAYNARVGTQLYYWHLEWTKTSAAHSVFFTVRDLESPGVDIVYEVIFPGAGGSTSISGGRTIVSEEYFHRGFEENNPSVPFNWNGDAIVYTLDVVAQILLQSPPMPMGSLQVNKDLEGWFDLDWGVGSATTFSAILMTQDGLYVMLREERLYGYQYVYSGLVASRELATVITFSEDMPALILGIPTQESALPTAAPVIYFIEEIFDVQTDMIQVTYSFGAGGFQIVQGETTQVTVTNTYLHAAGYLGIQKWLDGFPLDWGVDENTVFYVRIWDVDNDNYLLFKNYQEADGTFRCIGNHTYGLTESYLGLPMLEIPISVNQPVILSNLWTWGKYEVREVRQATTMPIESQWAAFWNNVNLDRDPTFQNRPGGVWTDGTWIAETWLGLWEDIAEVTDVSSWNVDDIWTWGVVYSDNNGVRELQFDENILITVTNLYKYISGNMTIVKDLAGYPVDWGVNDNTVFHAKVWDVPDMANPGNRNALIFEEILGAQGGYIYRNIGYIDNVTGTPMFYYSGDENIAFLYMVPFSVNSSAVLTDLPVGVDQYYFIEEFFGLRVFTGNITTTYVFNNVESTLPDGIFINAEEDISLIVRIQNEYAAGDGSVVIVKELDGFPGEWNVDEFTQFFAGVREVGTSTYLNFALQPDGSYSYIADVANYTGDVVWLIPFSASESAILTGLNPHVIYEVVELDVNGNEISNIFTTGFEVTVSYDRTAFAAGGNMIATVTNRFEHGVGILQIEKVLVNPPSYVNADTVFYARVRDATDENYLMFIPDAEALTPNTWRCVGNDFAGASENVPDPTLIQYEIPFSVNTPAILNNLWSGRVYVVEEIPGNYTSESDPLGIMWSGDVLGSTIINHFLTEQTFFKVAYDGNGNTSGAAPVDTQEYQEGELVVIQDQGNLARSGYSFMGWNTESDGSGDWYQPGDTFMMPAMNVIFYAQWQPLGGSGGGGGGGNTSRPTPPQEGNNGNGTTDHDGPSHTVNEFFVDEHIWYIRGYENMEIRPNNNVTRAEVAMIFYRLLRPEMKDFTIDIPFVDVRGDEWFGTAVGILVHHEILTGYENGEFRPNSPITRRELAAVVSRFDHLLATGENPYRDVSSNDWAYEYILSATRKGWFIGYNNLFRPEAHLTRAELVTAVNRILNRHILLEDVPDNVLNFSDLDRTHWSYTAFIEATHTHEFERKADGINEIWTRILGTGLDARYNQ